MTKTVNNGWQSISLLRGIGYFLLVLALLDVIDTFFPPQFMDPNWEFQVIGSLVERVPVPLLGLGLVFYGETDFRSKWSRQLLKVLSWASLLVGALFWLLIPLLLVDNSRLDNQINQQNNTQLTQQMSQLQQLENKVSKGTDKDLNDVADLLKNQGLPLELENSQSLKSRLLSEIAKAKQTIPVQVEAALESKRLSLIKTSAKWLLGTLVSGVAFIYIWYITPWARPGRRRM
jgi:hypothetical protein